MVVHAVWYPDLSGETSLTFEIWLGDTRQQMLVLGESSPDLVKLANSCKHLSEQVFPSLFN